jgi:hypothetical protein
MSKQKLFAAAVVTAFLLILIPAPSQASSHNWMLLSEPVAGIFAKIERWWNSILKSPERQEPSRIREKNGCGIDPNGQIICDPDGTARRTTQPGG